jgi:hypothetical protein
MAPLERRRLSTGITGPFDLGRNIFGYSGTLPLPPGSRCNIWMEATMHGIIYLVGLIVVVLAILSFFGLR